TNAGMTSENQSMRIARRPKCPISAYNASPPVSAKNTEPSTVNGSRIEDFFLDHCMRAELGADLLNQRLLFGCTRGGFELGKQFLHLAMVGLQQGNGVQMVFAWHIGPLSRSGSIIAPSKVARPAT